MACDCVMAREQCDLVIQQRCSRPRFPSTSHFHLLVKHTYRRSLLLLIPIMDLRQRRNNFVYKQRVRYNCNRYYIMLLITLVFTIVCERKKWLFILLWLIFSYYNSFAMKRCFCTIIAHIYSIHFGTHISLFHKNNYKAFK